MQNEVVCVSSGHHISIIIIHLHLGKENSTHSLNWTRIISSKMNVKCIHQYKDYNLVSIVKSNLVSITNIVFLKKNKTENVNNFIQGHWIQYFKGIIRNATSICNKSFNLLTLETVGRDFKQECKVTIAQINQSQELIYFSESMLLQINKPIESCCFLTFCTASIYFLSMSKESLKKH